MNSIRFAHVAGLPLAAWRRVSRDAALVWFAALPVRAANDASYFQATTGSK